MKINLDTHLQKIILEIVNDGALIEELFSFLDKTLFFKKFNFRKDDFFVFLDNNIELKEFFNKNNLIEENYLEIFKIVFNRVDKNFNELLYSIDKRKLDLILKNNNSFEALFNYLNEIQVLLDSKEDINFKLEKLYDLRNNNLIKNLFDILKNGFRKLNIDFDFKISFSKATIFGCLILFFFLAFSNVSFAQSSQVKSPIEYAQLVRGSDLSKVKKIFFQTIYENSGNDVKSLENWFNILKKDSISVIHISVLYELYYNNLLDDQELVNIVLNFNEYQITQVLTRFEFKSGSSIKNIILQILKESKIEIKNINSGLKSYTNEYLDFESKLTNRWGVRPMRSILSLNKNVQTLEFYDYMKSVAKKFSLNSNFFVLSVLQEGGLPYLLDSKGKIHLDNDIFDTFGLIGMDSLIEDLPKIIKLGLLDEDFSQKFGVLNNGTTNGEGFTSKQTHMKIKDIILAFGALLKYKIVCIESNLVYQSLDNEYQLWLGYAAYNWGQGNVLKLLNKHSKIDIMRFIDKYSGENLKHDMNASSEVHFNAGRVVGGAQMLDDFLK